MLISMVKNLFLWLMLIIHSVRCLVTDKEYARLPPVFEQDEFDRCMLLEDEALYCSIEFHLRPIQTKNPSLTWRNIEELNKNPKNYRHDILRRGICIPFSCPNISRLFEDSGFKDELAECYCKKYEKDGLYGTVGYMHCQTNETVPLDIYDHIVKIVLVIYIFFIIYCSLYEGIARYKSKEEYERITGTTNGKFLSCFSITRNWIRLKTINWTPELRALKGIQGVRVYCMLLVILCHACMMTGLGPISNTKFVEHFSDHPMTIFMASGPYGVEGFFLMSSWMLTYNVFKHFDKHSGKELDLKTMFTIFVHRYLRLTPPLAVMIILHSTLFYHASRAPWWDVHVGRDRTNCRMNGWTNLLYINNIFQPSEMCIIETWYMAVDMHGFFLVLAILYFTVKKPQRLWWIVPSVWLVIQTVHVKKIYDNDVYTFLAPTAENLYLMKGLFHGKDWIVTLASTSANMAGTLVGMVAGYVYYKYENQEFIAKKVTWNLYLMKGLFHGKDWIVTLASTSANMAGTLVGMVAGYVYYKYENQEFIAKKIHVVLWWLISFGIGFGIVILPGLWIFSENYYPTMWFSIPYFLFNTTIFGIAVSTCLIGFTKGIGWMAKWVVEWNPLYVLGRLSYSSFLVHYAIGVLEIGSSKQVTHFDDSVIIFEVMKLLTASFFFALILAITVELPVTALLSAFLKKNSGTELKKLDIGDDKKIGEKENEKKLK